MKIFNKNLRSYDSIFIIAETASSHGGQVDIAKKMADAVRLTSADAIKYQIFKADNLLVSGHHKYQDFKEIEFSDEQWSQIISYSRAIGLSVIAEVFDEESFILAQEMNIDVYKIPTSDLTNPFLLEEVASTQKTTILSVGAATEEEIDFAVKTCEMTGNFNLVLIHGFQSFPTKIEDTNFRLLEILKHKYKYEIGFADHIDAGSELSRYFPLIAVGHGASVIEKHITLDRSLKGRDYYSALNPDEFTQFVSLVRLIEKAYRISGIGSSPAETTYRNLMKKKVVAMRNIPVGKLITKEDICFRRSDEEGLIPKEYRSVLKKAKRLLQKNSTIKDTDVY